MFDTSTIIWGIIFGSVGLGFFSYGKKQKAFVPLICGLILCVFPYFVSNVFLLVGVGLFLSLLPFFVKF